jgi:PadR family transcriptional regulator PadR
MALAADLLRGSTDTILLRFLKEKDSYGYQINREIEQMTGGKFVLSEATLYTAFRRLEKAGLIVSYWGSENSGARRRYYRITEAGREAYRHNVQEWEEAQKLLERLIHDEQD